MNWFLLNKELPRRELGEGIQRVGDDMRLESFFLVTFFLQKINCLERCLSVEDWKRHVNILGLVVLEVRRDKDREEQPVGQHPIRSTKTIKLPAPFIYLLPTFIPGEYFISVYSALKE